jgi:CheY-like chemotaxis protein
MSGLLQTSLGPGVRIDKRFAEALSPVMIDGNQLELALLNLAVNARDAMPRGGVLTIAAHEETVAEGNTLKVTPGRYVCLCLLDQGEGMDDKTLARATEPFYTTKGVGKGTGLGLSMVEGLAAQSGGRLVLKSKKGEGTTAELWLPVAKEAREPCATTAAPAAPPVHVAPLTVLTVDDDALVLMNTVAMLQELGHTVIEAPAGQEALALLERDPAIGLLLTDQAMPQMTGAQLIDAVRLLRPGLPAILATGFAELSTAPPDRVPRLAKPFDLDALSEAIAAAVKQAPVDAG